MHKAKAICVILVMFVLVSPLNAAERQEFKGEQLTELQLQEFVKTPRFLPGKILFYCDLYEGYDNNVNFDSSRKGDLFTELALEAGFKQPFANGFDITLDYYLNAVAYHEITDGSFYDNNVSVEFKKELFDGLFDVGLGNNLEYNYYTKDEDQTFYASEPEIFIRHNITPAIYQKLIYKFIFREYTYRKAQDGARKNKSSERRDVRNSIAHELRAIIFEKYAIKIKNQYFVNDSNDQYMDYYDYNSYRLDVTVIVPILFEELYGLIGWGYQLRDYRTRQLVNDRSKTQKDDFYNVIASLIYDLNKAFSISANYTYNQNESSEPSEEYSGSTVTFGLHYAF